MEGSTDKIAWDTLDTVAGETNWGSGETRVYVCDTANTAYRYFRLNVSANNGDTYLIVGEMYLYEAEVAAVLIHNRGIVTRGLRVS